VLVSYSTTKEGYDLLIGDKIGLGNRRLEELVGGSQGRKKGRIDQIVKMMS
jgi:hypothetical protein